MELFLWARVVCPVQHTAASGRLPARSAMDSIIYLVGLVVIVMLILSALGLR
jgi:hypothetical protein